MNESTLRDSEGSVPGVLVFVESNLTGTGVQAIHLARAMGLQTVFLSGQLERYNADPKAAEAIRTQVDTVLECDTQDPVAMEKCLVEHGVQPTGVMTVMEYFVPSAAALARRLGLPGLSPDAAQAARDKYRTRVACAEKSVPVPAFQFVGSVDEVDAAIDRVGLPCVVKPVDESASIGVTLCRTRTQVAERIADLASRTVNSKGQRHEPGGLVEECLFGHEVSVETFTHDGRTTVLGVTDKLLGPTPYFLELGHTFPSVLPEGVTRAVADTTRAALQAIGFDFGPAHVELKLTERGPVLIEINARTGGDFIPDLVRHAIGIPLLEQSIIAHTGGVPDLEPRRDGGAAIRFVTGRSGTVASATGHDLAERFPSVVAFRMKAVPGAVTAWPTNSHDRLGHVMTSEATPAQAALHADAALAHLTVHYLSE
ncbi:ATP-grasp domain-containing protein [Streptomyces sp. NPDC001820]|uniref:ATP-grasp domain-containing protein n=1 Tax=Streptomyces sp. NPDC001820 TaxID=3364613 RepID=UPI00368C1967